MNEETVARRNKTRAENQAPAKTVPVKAAKPLTTAAKVIPAGTQRVSKLAPINSSRIKPDTVKAKPNAAPDISAQDKPAVEEVRKFLRKPCAYNKNIVFIQTQLYLARVHSKLSNFEKAKQFYEAVILKESQV